MKPWTKLQDWGCLVLGVVPFVAPWLFGTTTNGASSWNAWIVGLFTASLALFALFLFGLLTAVPAPAAVSRVLHSCKPSYHTSYDELITS